MQVSDAIARLRSWLDGTANYISYRGRAPDGVPQLRSDIEALIAALSALPKAEAVAVKPLEWNPFRAETPFGSYCIDDQTDLPIHALNGRPPFLLSGSSLTSLSRHPTLEAARAAAQADHDALVRSRLVAAPQPAVPEGWQPTHVHVKRGTAYQIISASARLQCSGTLTDNEVMVVYQGEDGQLWARAEYEFNDGRFVLAAPKEPSHG